jgi:hypothetical protein
MALERRHEEITKSSAPGTPVLGSTLVAAARDGGVGRLPPFDTELSATSWWKPRAAIAEVAPPVP